MTTEEFIREYERKDDIKGAIVEKVVNKWLDTFDDSHNRHIFANDIICSTWGYPEYYNFFNEYEEEIQATVGRKSLSTFLMKNGVAYDNSLGGCNSSNLTNLCEVVVILKVKEIQKDFKNKVQEETWER